MQQIWPATYSGLVKYQSNCVENSNRLVKSFDMYNVFFFIGPLGFIQVQNGNDTEVEIC